MKVYYNPAHIEKKKKTIVTIGTFDGVHLGHRKILDEVTRRAREIGGRSLVITFHPHPRFVVEPERKFELLTTIDEKMERFEKAGIDLALAINFTKEFSELSYKEFVEKIICDEIGVTHFVVGYDHRFGKNRSGDKEKLLELADTCDYTVSSVESVTLDGEVISSTKIRNLLREGNIAKANKFLGYNYSFWGKVVRGAQRGRTLGYPTANVKPEKDKLVPANGVYVVKVTVKDENYFGLMNIGNRPTFENLNQKIIETYIFDFNENIYARNIRTEILARLRDEKKFVTKEALLEQIETDISEARKVIEANGKEN